LTLTTEALNKCLILLHLLPAEPTQPRNLYGRKEAFQNTAVIIDDLDEIGVKFARAITRAARSNATISGGSKDPDDGISLLA
jgi:hypothetical protein